MQNAQIRFAMIRIPLILSGLGYFLAGGAFYLVMQTDAEASAELPEGAAVWIALFCAVLGLAAIALAGVIRRKSKIVYILALITSVLYIPSLFIFFGIPMLIFLLREDVRAYYGIRVNGNEFQEPEWPTNES